MRVTPEERESVEARITELPLRRRHGVESDRMVGQGIEARRAADGVRIRGVRPGGPAAEGRPALEQDDVIIEVDGTPVENVDALTAIVEQRTKGKQEPVSVARDVRSRAAADAHRCWRSGARASKIRASRRARPGFRYRCRS